MTYRQRRAVVYLGLGCLCMLIGAIVPVTPYGLALAIVGFGFVVIV